MTPMFAFLRLVTVAVAISQALSLGVPVRRGSEAEAAQNAALGANKRFRRNYSHTHTTTATESPCTTEYVSFFACFFIELILLVHSLVHSLILRPVQEHQRLSRGL